MRDSWLFCVLTLPLAWGCPAQPTPTEATSAPPSTSQGSSATPAAAVEQPTPTVDSEPESDDGTRRFDFDGDALGQTPPGFQTRVGTWQVVEDASAPSGGRALAQQAQNADPDFNVLLATNTRFADVDLSVRLRAVAGRIDRGGGLVWRAQGGRDYYVARYNPLEDNFRLYSVVHGVRRMLLSSSPQLDHDAWHTMRVVMRGDHIECSLDGERYLDAHDATFADAGSVGLWTKADAQTRFDDLVVAAATGEAG
jgi:hypothetical protein